MADSKLSKSRYAVLCMERQGSSYPGYPDSCEDADTYAQAEAIASGIRMSDNDMQYPRIFDRLEDCCVDDIAADYDHRKKNGRGLDLFEHEEEEVADIRRVAGKLDPAAPIPLNIYYVRTPENTFAVVAAPSESACRKLPPFSNWRDLLAFGGWDEGAGASLSVSLLAAESRVLGTPGVLIAGGAGFYSPADRTIKPV